MGKNTGLRPADLDDVCESLGRVAKVVDRLGFDGASVDPKQPFGAIEAVVVTLREELSATRKVIEGELTVHNRHMKELVALLRNRS